MSKVAAESLSLAKETGESTGRKEMNYCRAADQRTATDTHSLISTATLQKAAPSAYQQKLNLSPYPTKTIKFNFLRSHLQESV